MSLERSPTANLYDNDDDADNDDDGEDDDIDQDLLPPFLPPLLLLLFCCPSSFECSAHLFAR